MKLSLFMVIAAIVTLIFGVGFILAPVAALSAYGNTVDLTGQFMTRYLGAAFIGIAFLTWLTRNAPASETRMGVLTSLFVTSLLTFVVALYDKFAGTGNALLWLNVVITLLLTIGFGYFRFMKKD